MRIYTAQVFENKDLTSEGKMWVYCKPLGENLVKVFYTSPYNANREGGFIAIPEVGTEILITQPDDTVQWYYLASIFGPREGVANNDRILELTRSSLPDRDIYKARGIPQKLVWQDPRGNKITISNLYNPGFFNNKVELKSGVGKKVAIMDSPKQDCILIKNELDDGIKITSKPNALSAARSVEIESKGPQKFICRESQIDVLVKDGREINIVNESTSLNANPQEPEKFGNINLVSKNNDINIVVEEKTGKVFIDALGVEGLIQLDTAGRVIINGKNIDIRADGGDLNIQVGGNLNIDVEKSVSIKAGQSVVIDAGNNTHIQAKNTTYVEGSIVHLDSDQEVPATDVNIQKQTSNYGN